MRKNAFSILWVIIIAGILFLATSGAAFGFLTIRDRFGRNPGQTVDWTGTALSNSIPAEWQGVFEAAGDKWNVLPAFVAAVFAAGEHRYYQSDSWPAYEEEPAYGSGLNPRLHNCGKDANKYSGHDNDRQTGTSWGGCIRGPVQMNEANWATYGEGDLSEMDKMTPAIFAMAHKLALNGASGNTSDENRLKDAASLYNSGKKWSVIENGGGYQETKNYVPAVYEAFLTYSAGGGSNDIIIAAKKYLGIPYSQTLGRCGPDYFDCSGFATTVYEDVGLIPQGSCNSLTTQGIAHSSLFVKIPADQRRPGDILLFWMTADGNKTSNSHAAIYMGATGANGAEQIIEATQHDRDGVQINDLGWRGRVNNIYAAFRAKSVIN